MAQMRDGMNYAPEGKVEAVVGPGEFGFGVAALDHGHINGMTNGLKEAGAALRAVYDPDPQKVEAFKAMNPEAEVMDSLEELLARDDIQMVAAAAITSEREPLGAKVLQAGKHYFTDKAPLVSLEQLEDAKHWVKETGKRYFCYFSERLHVEAAVYAGQLVQEGRIGKVIQVLGLGPHRLNASTRPDWFFKHDQYGGILTDIGSHQIEQFLFFTGATDAEVVASQVGNYHHPQYQELEDFGDCMLAGSNGATNYFRVDWFTPDGLSTWGDGRLVILGTDGYIELRKYTNLATESSRDHVFVADQEGEHHYHVTGKVGFPFFGEMILDCINGTEHAMTQDHIFKAAELAVRAQMQAQKRGFAEKDQG